MSRHAGALLLLWFTAGTAQAHPIVDAITSASRSSNPTRACDFDRDGAIRSSRYCRCNNQALAGPGNYDRRGSREFCACDPAVQHCDADGTYDDGTPRYRWTIDCNDFDGNAYPQRCDARDCNQPPGAQDHCGGVVGGDDDGDGHGGVASGGDDCDDRNPAVYPGAFDACGDGLDADCDGLDCTDIDEDGDGVPAVRDCDDSNPAVYPGAAERCGNGLDDDCQGGDAVCTQDLDHDGYDAAAAGGQDCDDLDSTVHPGARERVGDGIDQDCDGADLTAAEADADGDGFVAAAFGGGDCDDGDPARNPGALDVCGDGIDQDCSGGDRVCPSASDLDEDGHRDPASGGADCDDLDSRRHPGAVEICGDGIDQDCDGADLPCDGPTLAGPDRRRTNRADAGATDANCQAGSGPGAGLLWLLALGALLGRRRRSSSALLAVLLPSLSLVPGTAQADACVDLDGDGHEIWWFDSCGDDCNDLDPTIHPGAPEVCGDGIDNNCNQQVDEGCEGARDADGDGVAGDADCDDGDPRIYPGSAEVCGDGIDQNCDGRDEVCVVDEDGDGVVAEVDCDDGDPDVRPGAPEQCGDGVDQDCDGADAPCEMDADGDGHLAVALGGDDCDDHDRATHPQAAEVCGDGRDQDCDGADAPCDRDGDGVPADEDCNDWVAAIRPGVEDICGDGIDQDCDGQDALCVGAADDADGDGFRGTAFGGDDCQDHDRARHPGALEICGDGVDQDCDGADLPCDGAPDPALTAQGPVHSYAAGDGVPAEVHTARCSASPGADPGSPALWALLPLVLLGLRRRLGALLVATLALGGCAAEEAEPTEWPELDPEFYAAHVDPLLARGCSTMACHGNPDRPWSMFVVSRQRLNPDRLNTPIGDDELCVNYLNARAFAATDPDASLLISKPLFLEEGGTWHGGGYHFGTQSDAHDCLALWLRGERATFDADGQVQIPTVCRFDWNIDAAGEPVRYARRGLRCGG